MVKRLLLQKLAADALNSFRDHTQVVADGLEESSDRGDQVIAEYLRKNLGEPIIVGLIAHWSDNVRSDLAEVVASLTRLAKNPYYFSRSTKGGRAVIKVYTRRPRKAVKNLVPVIVDGRATDITFSLEYDGDTHTVMLSGETVERILIGSPIYGSDEEYHPSDIERLRKTIPELDISRLKEYVSSYRRNPILVPPVRVSMSTAGAEGSTGE